jgi:hypothetical protein
MLAENVQGMSGGVIREGELYTLAAFKRCLSLSESAARALRLKGLPVIRFGKRGFVSGRRAIEFLEQFHGNRNPR